MQSNLARRIENETYIKTRDNMKKINMTKKRTNDKRIYMTFALYGVLILSVAYIYVNSIIKKTNSNIRLKTASQREKNLINQVKELETKYSIAIDLDKVEEQSKRELNMKVIDEVKYVKIK